MSASDELPRGWAVQKIEERTGNVCAFSAPAIPGISHVLTDFKVRLVKLGGGLASAFVNVTIGATIIQHIVLVTTNGTDPAEVDFSGKIQAPTGVALGITFDRGDVTFSEEIYVQGFNT